MPASTLSKRGFAAAVRAHQAGAVLGRDHPVEIFKQQLGAEALAGAGKLDHLFLVSLTAVSSFAQGFPRLHSGSPTTMFIQLSSGIAR